MWASSRPSLAPVTVNTPDVVAAAQNKQGVVVLGAGGFIGRRVVEALAASDWARPVAVGRRIEAAVLHPAARRLAIDACDEGALQSALEGASGVVNCIAGSPESIVRSGRALLDVTARMPVPPRVVYLSSLAVYGAVSGTVDENSPLREDYSAYGTAKVLVDRLMAERSYAVCLRPGIVYGPGSPWWTDRIARLLVARRLGDLGDAGQGRCNLVHVDDVVSAILASLRAPAAAGQAFNLGSPVVPTWNEYFVQYARALQAQPVRRIDPRRLQFELKLYGPWLKVRERMVGNDAMPALRPWLTELCRLGVRMRVERAEQVLGLRWKPLEQGLDECARWFLAGNRTSAV